MTPSCGWPLQDVCGNKAQIDRLMDWLREWEDRHVKGVAAMPKGRVYNVPLIVSP
jgi:hypothetical protein